jgi:hypothetical protein
MAPLSDEEVTQWRERISTLQGRLSSLPALPIKAEHLTLMSEIEVWYESLKNLSQEEVSKILGNQHTVNNLSDIARELKTLNTAARLTLEFADFSSFSDDQHPEAH